MTTPTPAAEPQTSQQYPDGYYRISDDEESYIGYVRDNGIGDDRVEWCLEEGYTLDPVVVMTQEFHDDLSATIATQAARIAELEQRVKQAVSVYREVAGMVLSEDEITKARIIELERQLAEATAWEPANKVDIVHAPFGTKLTNSETSEIHQLPIWARPGVSQLYQLFDSRVWAVETGNGITHFVMPEDVAVMRRVATPTSQGVADEI